MAMFKSTLWTYLVLMENQGEQRPDSNKMLEVAIALWLRTLGTAQDNELGLANIIRITVPSSNHLFFAEGIPNLNVTAVSTGHVLDKIPGVNILWTSKAQAQHNHLTLDYIQYVSNEVRIHVRWLEYALAKAIVSLYNHGIDWTAKFKKAETIGGIEKADWL